MVKVNGIVLRLRASLALAALLLLGGAALSVLQPAHAQPPSSNAVETLTASELEELVGPIALYPDDLVGVVLPASTFPLEVVEAARLLERRERDSDLQPDPEWDDSVVALLNYPDVVELMNDDLDWTWRLGEAVLNQRPEVLDAIQRFRDRAYAAGNLRTDDRQVVSEDDAGIIEIRPADPEVIYVPYYEPARVVVYQPAPVYHYYPFAYPVYYYPYPVGYSFSTGFFWGVTSAFSIGWHSHFLHVHHHSQFGHPYYGWRYYDPFYYRRNVYINVFVDRDRHVWQPRYRQPGRPFARSDERRVNAGVPATRAREGYRADRDGVARSGRTTAPPRNVARDGDDRRYRTGSGGVSRALERRPSVQTPSTGAAGSVERQRQRPPPQAPADRSVRPTERQSGGTAQPPRRLGTIERAPPQRVQPQGAPGGQARAAERSRPVPGATAERYRAPGAATQRYGGPASSAERSRVPTTSTAERRYGGTVRPQPDRSGGQISRQAAPQQRANPATRSSERSAGSVRGGGGRGQQNQTARGGTSR